MSQTKTNIRDRRKKARQRQARGANLLIGALVAFGVLTVSVLVWKSIGRPPIGETFPISGEGEHVPDGNPLPLFNTDPPTSGPHYNTPLPEGFYDTDSQEAVSLPNPQGFLVHSMEHGYVIFWYNCDALPEEGCEPLKEEIRGLMESYNNFKIIAFPWSTTDVPVVATSWGRMIQMDAWDAELASNFIERNRNQAPEPNAR